MLDRFLGLVKNIVACNCTGIDPVLEWLTDIKADAHDAAFSPGSTQFAKPKTIFRERNPVVFGNYYI